MDRQSIQIRKILRSPTLKRKTKTVPVSERVVLERVLGLTVTNNAGLDCDPVTGNVAYLAGCVAVVYNAKKGRQSHVFNSSKKTLTCLQYSRDGKHLVTGEAGHQPTVRVWDLEEKIQVAEFQVHKFGISCVAFSPNLKYVLSIGTEHDMGVNVWNWRTGIKVASNKVAQKVSDVAFSEDSSMFVTVGNRLVKFWYLDASKSKIKTETMPLLGRNGILGEHKNNFFCGVCCGKGQRTDTVFSITESGLLCEFNDQRLLSKWVQLRTDRAYAIANSDRHVFIGCANGLVRVFDATSLHFLATLPCPHHLGVDVASGISLSNVSAIPDGARFPDTVAVCHSATDNRLTCIYNDHSIYIWDISDIRKVGKTRSFLFHSGAVWGVDANVVGNNSLLPMGTFVTCSSDNTIRFWNCDPHASTNVMKRNIYSHELLKILYQDNDYNCLLDIAYNPAGKKDKTDTAFQDKDKCGIRCIRLNPAGDCLASGDRTGNIRVHDLQTMKQIAHLEAHDSEVLCLEFTQPGYGVELLSTASRDRLLHVFDVNHDYGLVQTLDDHSAAITSVQFTLIDNQLTMLSCGLDKSILFRNAVVEPDFRFVLNRHMVSRTTLYDMKVNRNGKFVATACQDRNIRIYNTRNGKQQKIYSGSPGNDGILLRTELDSSGRYIGTSCSDKTLSIYDFYSGECAATMFGHSEISTGIKFLNDGKHFVSVSGDSCIFLWRLPSEFLEHAGEKHDSVAVDVVPDTTARRETFVVNNKNLPLDTNDNFRAVDGALSNITDSPDTASPHCDYRFSVGQLPSWAKRQVLQDPHVNTPASGLQPSNGNNAAVAPKSRWASRVDDQGIVLKSWVDSNPNQDIGILSESSITSPPDGKPKVAVITDDDETNRDEDIEDEFRLRRSLDFGPNFESGGKQSIGANDSRGSGLSWQLSQSTEDDDDDVESNGGDAKETVYYLPSADVENDAISDSAFKVHEGPVETLSVISVDTAEDDDEELVKSPVDPVLDMSSPEDDFGSHDQFDMTGISRETFDSKLKQIEQKMNSLVDANTQRTVSSRQSISAMFLSKNPLPNHKSQARDAFHQHDVVGKDNAVKFAEEPKKRLSNESHNNARSRDSGGTTLNSTVSASRRVTRLGSTGTDSKLSSTSGTDMKNDNLQSSTLPRTASRNSSKSRHSDVHAPGVTIDASDSTAAANKRRSAAGGSQSYRMQTESSLAKVSATGKENHVDTTASTAPTKNPVAASRKESLGANRFQSTPNLNEQQDDEAVDDKDPIVAAKKGQASLTDDDFNKVSITPGFGAIIAGRRPDVTALNRSKTFSGSSRDVFSKGTTAAGAAKNNDPLDRALMPPPISVSVPSSIQASFIAKAEKLRRTTMPESALLAQNRHLSTSNDKIAATTEALPKSVDSFHGSASLGTATAPLAASGTSVRDCDASPLEPPVRDNAKTLSDIQAITKRLTEMGSQLTSVVSKASTTSTSTKDSQAVSKAGKIARCSSPLKPFIAKSMTPTPQAVYDIDDISAVGQYDAEPHESGVSTSPHRRQLPADPKASDRASLPAAMQHSSPNTGNVQVSSAATDGRPVDSSSRPGSDSLLYRSNVNPAFSSTGRHSLGGGGVPVSNSAAAKANSSPFQNVINASSLMRQSPVPLAPFDSSNPAVQDSGRTASSQQLQYEIEKFCEERRRAKDLANVAERPDRLPISSVISTRTSASSSSCQSPFGGSQHSAESDLDRNPVQQLPKPHATVVRPSTSYTNYKPTVPSALLPTASDDTNASSGDIIAGGSSVVSSAVWTANASPSSAVRGEGSPGPLDMQPTTSLHTYPRRSVNRATPDGISPGPSSRRSRAQTNQELVSDVNGDQVTTDSKPSSSTSFITSVYSSAGMNSAAKSVIPTSANDSKANPAVDVSSDAAEDECFKLAADLSQAVSRATDLYVQMSDNADEVSKATAGRASRDRAVRLLRDSLRDASLMLSKSLGLVSDRGPSSSCDNHQTMATVSTTEGSTGKTDSTATMHIFESMLKRYSEQLSTQVCELFQQKLDELEHQGATKL